MNPPRQFLAIFAVAGMFAPAAVGELTNRWSFNRADGAVSAGTEMVDDMGGPPAIVRGSGAIVQGGQIVLPGETTCGASDATISAYIDLPNGLLSSNSDLTVELWATPLSFGSWQALFEIGRLNTAGDGAAADGEWTGTADAVPDPSSEGGDIIALLLSRGETLNQQRQENRRMGGNVIRGDSDLPTTEGQAYHYVLTFEEGAGAFGESGGQVRWYRDGAQASSVDVDFHLSDLHDVNAWLGRSHLSTASTTNASYQEVRFYDHAFRAVDVVSSRDAGPAAVVGPPEPAPDIFTIHDGQKIRGTILQNDLGLINSATVEIVQEPSNGTATPDASGRILYTHAGHGVGGDSFTYRVSGPFGTSDPAPVTVEIANTLRIPNTAINVPGAPPSTAYELVPALNGLSFTRPTDFASLPNDPQRLWITGRRGLVWLVPDITAASPSKLTFLDLKSLLRSRGEDVAFGLLSIVFHPSFHENGYFYLFYSVESGGKEYYRLSRFSVQGDNPSRADAASEFVLIEQYHNHDLHLGADMSFGTDGYLYYSVGDERGGSINDQRIDLDLYSGIMRIDVDKLPGNLEPHPHEAVLTDGGIARYSIPMDNPFVTAEPTVTYNGQEVTAGNVRTEFWATGLRNPFRFSFDSETGEMWVGDVGGNKREEISIVTAGGNYGWAFLEGRSSGRKHSEMPAGWTGIDPVYEYTHGNGEFQGHSVTGGIVYRGTKYPKLNGAYLFADFSSGHLWALRRPDGQVQVERLTGDHGIVAFGIDPSNGDILMADHGSDRMLRLVISSENGNGFPATLGETGLFADLSDLSPAPGLLPYEPNLSFWSDFAKKRRWFMIPDGTSKISWAGEGPWSFPAEMIWVKHFEMELERGNPASARRMETRLLVKNSIGSFGVSYRWDESGTEAELVRDAGEQMQLEIMEDGVPRTQIYRIPSRAECAICHTANAGHALSFNTRQLNRDQDMLGFAGNQIDQLAAHGFFANAAQPGNTLARHARPEEPGFTIEEKARAYLAVNCSNCHRPGGIAGDSWDGRAELTLAETNLIHGAPINNGGDPANLLIVPGDPSHSIVFNRLGGTNGFGRMPQIGSSELDQEALNLMTAWIHQLDTPALTYEEWRIERFGDAISAVGEPGADPDGDRFTNEEEFLAGTIPLDASSHLRVQFSALDGWATIEFSTADVRPYLLETSTNLKTWMPWKSGLTSFARPTREEVRIGGDLKRFFFRVGILGP